MFKNILQINQYKSFGILSAFIMSTALLLLPSLVQAETHVYYLEDPEHTEWNKEGSPYILEGNIHVSSRHSLFIGEGVEVLSAVSPEDNEPYGLNINGNLTISGTKENPVVFKNLSGIYFGSSNSYIENAVFTGTTLEFVMSTSTLKSVTIKDAFEGISAEGSIITISDSNLINNSYGIFSRTYAPPPIFQVKTHSILDSIANVFINTAHATSIARTSTPPIRQNTIKINNSTISGNSQFGIINQTVNTIDARDIWWGKAKGPYLEGSGNSLDYGDKVSGLVDIAPWKNKDPKGAVECCSNILFVPGIEASRLYKDKTVASVKIQDMLWEPNISTDVDDLRMNEKGISVNKLIYTKDIIDTPYGLGFQFLDVYKNFIISMDALVASSTVKAWLPLPYDWRKSVTDVADGATLNKIYALATSSKTGKITVIAHSNGGLVTKSIMKKLEEAGKADIVERIIFVGVPELGTPEAILALLHGYNQSLGLGAILSANAARNFAQNVPGVYGLLPSRKFFEKNPMTVITDSFSKGSRQMSSYAEMKDFLLNSVFSLQKAGNDINIPIKLNSYLLGLADTTHALLDSWKPGTTTKITNIAGWGRPTSHAVTYREDPHCGIPGRDLCDLEFVAELTDNGDGTVITESASGNPDSTLFFNLKKLKEDNGRTIKHSNIMESNELFSKIKDTITNTASVGAGYEKYFTATQPVSDTKYLTLTIHSPVDVDVYDKDGKHTGPVTDATGRVTYEDQIPGSYYGVFGRVKLVRIPYDPEKYQIALSGNDAGVFSVDAAVSQGDAVVATTTFSEMPVTPLTNIDLKVPTSTETFKTETLMNMDIDGDGTTDLVNRTDQFLNATTTGPISDFPTYIASLKQIIVSLNLPDAKEKLLLKRVDALEKTVEKKRLKKAEKATKKLSNKIFKNKKINDIQKTALLAKIDELLVKLEKMIK